MDVTEVVTYIETTVTGAVALIAAAALILYIGIKGWKAVRGAM